MKNFIPISNQTINFDKVVRIEREASEDEREASAKIVFEDGDYVYTDESYDEIIQIVLAHKS